SGLTAFAAALAGGATAFFGAGSPRRGAGAAFLAAAGAALAAAFGLVRADFFSATLSSLCLRSGLGSGGRLRGLCFGALGHLLAGLSFIRVVLGFALHNARLVKEPCDTVRRQGAFLHPVLNPLQLKEDPVRIVGLQDRVVSSNFLDETPITRATAVGHNDRVERTLLRAATGQTDFQGHFYASPLNS